MFLFYSVPACDIRGKLERHKNNLIKYQVCTRQKGLQAHCVLVLRDGAWGVGPRFTPHIVLHTFGTMH